MQGLVKFGMLSMMLAAAACAPRTYATATEDELCRAWGAGLFLPSRADTDITVTGLNDQIRDYRAACPGFPAP